jgi:hypothetical protein
VKALKKGCAKSTVRREFARAAAARMNARSEYARVQPRAAKYVSNDRDTFGLRTTKRV